MSIVIRSILVTDLSQQMKKQRDFLKWMGRRYAEVNEEQSDAFFTGARLFDELRLELVGGLFDELELPATLEPTEKDLFTEEPAGAAIYEDDLVKLPPAELRRMIE